MPDVRGCSFVRHSAAPGVEHSQPYIDPVRGVAFTGRSSSNFTQSVTTRPPGASLAFLLAFGTHSELEEDEVIWPASSGPRRPSLELTR